MNLSLKVKAVERIFNTLHKDISNFQEKADFACFTYCSHCCSTPNIEATILEFLPLAYHLYKQNNGEFFLDKLISEDNNNLCPLYSPLGIDTPGWGCTMYPYRGLICRLFGFSARMRKDDKKELIACKVLKQKEPEKINFINENINQNLKIAMISDYYRKLNNIDLNLSDKTYPIRIAITKAIEIVLFYTGFRFRKTRRIA